VVLIARYQIVTKGYLDGSDFVRELDAICTFPSGRSNFVLGDFLIDPDQPAGENRWRTFLPISHQGDLFQALRGILGGICCEHPCVVTVHGWNIVDREGQWSVVIETDEAERLSIGDFERWTALDQSKFLLSAAIGVLDLHVRGVFHNNLQDAGAIQVHNGRARIFSFGLLDANASFEADTIACRELFGRATSSSSRLVREVNDEYGLHWCEPNFQGYIEEVLDEERHSSPGGEGPLQDLASDIANDAKPKYFPFDLFFHLVHSPELWRRRDGPLDVAGGLAELTRGLDEEGKTRFEKEVNAEIAAHRFLRPGFPNTP
jgi:hypothetical protein